MITRKSVLDLAGQTGFRSEVVEKVLRLQGILARLDRHPATRAAWLLKGGTALNLLHLDVPRLSVDIDLDYIGAEDPEAMREARGEFERGLAACCEREGCTIRRAPEEHAGGKFRLRYSSVIGGSQNLEVDVSYVARVPLWGVVRSGMRFPPGNGQDVPSLTIEELAAGKFAALVDRGAPRDVFDAAALLDILPDLPRRVSFRTSFVCSIAAVRTDPRRARPGSVMPDAAVLTRDLLPLLRSEGVSASAGMERLAERLQACVQPALVALFDWTGGEASFLDKLLDEGEVDAALLHPDPEVQDRIRRQPMLQWKARHVREWRGRSGG